MRMNFNRCIDDVDAVIADHIGTQARDVDSRQKPSAAQQVANDNCEQLDQYEP